MANLLDWKSVLVATDFSDSGKEAVATAMSLVKGSKGKLAVVSVAERPPMFPHSFHERHSEDPDELWSRHARTSMKALVKRLQRQFPATRGFVRVGTPWREIVALAEELRVDAIVVGSRGLSAIQRLLLGSTAENVVRHASCPVLVVRDGPLKRARKVLLPVDWDEGSKAAVRYAVERAGSDVKLHAIHAIGFPRMIEPEFADALADDAHSSRKLRKFLDGLGAEHVSSKVILGEPAEAILDAAEDFDLVVIATRGRKGAARALLGSVAEKVVRRAAGPILVIPTTRPRKSPSGARRTRSIKGEVALNS
ncbi:MAG TPA: universal stress protein [Gemmatimonadota bacterium]|jgi:nucleotide-binding universal stress UspA family protein|nr:universal stress protein [Gemmatimonadota bacterium]